MIGYVSKVFFQTLAGSQTLKRLASRYGMRSRHSFARRFIAGETVDEAIAAARTLEASGLLHTLDLLGESVNTMAAADAATRAYLATMDRIASSGIGRGLSLKLTQLGLSIDRATCTDNLRRILDRAGVSDFFVRVDMENSPFTQVTLDVFETMWQLGYRNVGIVLQSCLRRTRADAERMMALGASVRLVKGAYQEPKRVAYQRKSEVDAAFVEVMELLLASGHHHAIATHDPALIDAARRFAAGRGIGADRFEFQMLYGIRRDLQAQLRDAGYRVRVYVPFGREWFPYFMRRLGERPANVGFVIRGVLSERHS
jgi:proline dehydrogenase